MPESNYLNKDNFNPNYQLHPAQLDEDERAQHVVNALLDYNRGIIQANPTGANAKFEKLTLSEFVFMRGTADLMYRDLRGTDANMATVLCMGDVHPENYGVMESESNKLIWGLNDFDEALFAPFTWDVKRGVTSTLLAARQNDMSTVDNIRIARKFCDAYLATIQRGLSNVGKANFTSTEGPSLIKKLIKKAEDIDPKQWLKDEYLDPGSSSPKFKKTEEIQPLPNNVISSRIEAFKAITGQYLTTLTTGMKNPIKKIDILDVATKVGSGTGSIGLWRYYVLVNAKREQGKEMVILEVKQQRPSVLQPYTDHGPLLFSSEAARISCAEDVKLPNANPYYGHIMMDGHSYLVRKRSPHKRRVKLNKLSKNQFGVYSEACGEALAHSHLRSSRILSIKEKQAAKRILRSVNPETFVDDMIHFAEAMAKRITKDWEIFKASFALSTFKFEVDENSSVESAK